MQEVNIYIELDSIGPRTRQGRYGYVLECGQETREGFGYAEGTVIARFLQAAGEALGRINKPCAVNIFLRNRWLAHAINNEIPVWQRQGWKNAKGEEIKNRELWQRLAAGAAPHDVMAFSFPETPYTDWLKREIEKRGQDGSGTKSNRAD